MDETTAQKFGSVSELMPIIFQRLRGGRHFQLSIFNYPLFVG